MENDSSQPTQSSQSRKQWIIENVVSLGLALLVVLMIRSSVIEAFKIPSGSMIPTLLVGDHIFVNKFAYGFKVPFSDWVTDHPVYFLKRETPKSGDIIVFMFPKDESIYYIKRVIGTPGDTVEMRNKVLYINQKMVPREQVLGQPAEHLMKELDDPKYNLGNFEIYSEHLNQENHSVLFDRTSFMSENYGPIVVPSDSLFVMGDNRDFSNDSRFWGFVPMRNVKGKAIVVWLSLWVSFSESQFIFRPERIGKVIH